MNKALNSGKIHPFHRSRLAKMPLSYKVVHLFASPQGHLVKIKLFDRQPDTPEPANEWLWVTEQSVTSLRHLHMKDETQQVKVFREARLQLDGQRAELTWTNGQQLTLAKIAAQTLPAELRPLIHNHLS